MLESVNRLFNDPTARRVLLAARYPIFIALVVLLALYAQRAWLPAAFAVSAFGEFIQVWSFASLVKNEQLTARGPYVLVRNPMYLGRFFLILGLLMLFGNVWVLVAYTVFYWFYMANRVGREEKRLRGLLGEPYERYCAQVNRFWPTLSRLTDPAMRFFSVSVLRRNNGHWNLLSMLAAYAVIWVYIAWVK